MKFKIIPILDVDHFVQQFFAIALWNTRLQNKRNIFRLKISPHLMVHFHHPSITPFVQKLMDKNQTEQQRKQGFDAVSIFSQIEKKKADQDNAWVLKDKNEDIANGMIELKPTNADWRPAYLGLDSEIKLRHYS